MKPALSQVCSLNSPFDRDLEDYGAGHCEAIEIWLGKLEAHLESHSLESVKTLIAQRNMAAPVASYQGGLLTSQGERRREHWEHFRKRLGMCRDLEIQTLVIAADIHGPLAQQTLDRVAVSLTEAASLAEQFDTRLALEFQSTSSFANNLQTAAALVADAANSHLGICLDVFHFYCGPSKLEDLAYLNRENLFHVQLSDLAGQARELATDADRILPGDGDIDLEPLVEHLRRINYGGYVSVELMNPQLWQVPARSFGEIAITALRKVLGQASMQ